MSLYLQFNTLFEFLRSKINYKILFKKSSIYLQHNIANGIMIFKFVNIVPWFCDIGNTRGRKTCITMAWRLWFHSERINNDRTTADRQTPQKACKIDGFENISGAGDPNHRTDPDKNLYNDEQIQKPVCACSRTQRTTSID